MKAAFPVYRRGKLIESGLQISPQTADVIANLVVDNEGEYSRSVLLALKKVGVNQVTPSSEGLQKPSPFKRIFNFPKFEFRKGRFTVEARCSLTVCVGTRRSKIWVWMDCKDFDERSASRLDTEAVRAFFIQAEEWSEGLLGALFQSYRKHLAGAGIALSSDPAYTFCFRAFNSPDEIVEELYERVSTKLPLTQALRQEPYAGILQSFFQVASETEDLPSQDEIEAEIRSGELDVFGYHSPEHNALFAARTTSAVTDLCGFGFDQSEQFRHTLAHAATGTLLEEYARQF